jgi:ABC-type nitrate/sulfonate/bicarbonate transport system substrate-binding protein
MTNHRLAPIILGLMCVLAACTAGSSAATSAAVASGAVPAGEASDELPVAERLAAPEVKSITFGISEVNPAHFALQLAFYSGMFEKYGLTAEPRLLEGADATLAALTSGELDVASASSGQTILSLLTGTPAVDIGQLTPRQIAALPPAATPPPSGAAPVATAPPTPFAGSNVMVLRSFADKNPNTTLAVAAAVLEATQLPYTDLDTVVKAYAKWAQVDEAEAKANWQAYLDSGIAQRDLRSSVEAYQNARDVLLTVNPDVKDVDLSKAFDGSFLDKLEAMGLNDELGIPKS